MKKGQFVRHSRNPEYGIGKVVDEYIYGSLKVVFPKIIFNGIMQYDLDAVSDHEQEQLELKEAKQGGPEAMSAWEMRQSQKEKEMNAKHAEMYHLFRRYSKNRMSILFDEISRLSLQANANSKKTHENKNNQDSPTSGSIWWYQAFRRDTPEQKFLHIETRVVGVTYENRQSLIAGMQESERVLLVREPDNPFDSNAIAVKRVNGRCIGYLPREEAANLAGKFDTYGKTVSGKVTAILGKHFIDGQLGLRISFSLPESEPVEEGTVHPIEPYDPYSF